MEKFLFILKVIFIIAEFGFLTFLVMIVWFPLQEFSTYSKKEQFEILAICILAFVILLAIGITIYEFFFSQGMSCLIPFFIPKKI